MADPDLAVDLVAAADRIGDILFERLLGGLFHPFLVEPFPGTEGVEDLLIEDVQAEQFAVVPMGDPRRLGERVLAVGGVVDADDDRSGCFHGSIGVWSQR